MASSSSLVARADGRKWRQKQRIEGKGGGGDWRQRRRVEAEMEDRRGGGGEARQRDEGKKAEAER